MATLFIDGLDEQMKKQLEGAAIQLNLSVNELVKQIIHKGLNNILPFKKTTTIDSLFGMINSSTDGVYFQHKMREE